MGSRGPVRPARRRRGWRRYVGAVALSVSALSVSALTSTVAMAARPFQLPATAKNATHEVNGSHDIYSIRMGGTLDEFNTSAYRTIAAGHRRLDNGFQPNKFLMIENTGTTNIYNPQITVNGRRDWFSTNSILSSITTPQMTPADKAMAIYRHVASYDTQCHDNNRRVGPELPENEKNLMAGQFKELADPVKQANAYYCSGCSLLSANLVVLARQAGFDARVLWVSPADRYKTHAVAEVFYDNDWHVFDPDRRAFYVESDNRTVASYKDLHDKPSLVTRTHLGGFASNGITPTLAEDFGKYWPPKEMPVDSNWQSSLDMRLRPGEKFVYRWDNDGKFRWGNNPRNPGLLPPQLANGKLIFDPRLDDRMRAEAAESQANVTTRVTREGTVQLVPQQAGSEAGIVYRVDSPYPIVGGMAGGKFERGSDADTVKIMFSRDGKKWYNAWTATETGRYQEFAPLDKLLNAGPSDPIYNYFIKFIAVKGNDKSFVSLSDLRIETDVQMAKTSLPSLSVGDNQITYNDRTPVGSSGSVRITHGWQESSATRPPTAPQQALNPKSNDVVPEALTKILRWTPAIDPDGRPILGYHVQLSTSADMATPLSPSFDRMTYSPNPEWKVPAGWLLPDRDYFWHVRAADEWGAWSSWSPTWKFRIASNRSLASLQAVVVPEPSSFLLLAVAGTATFRRRREAASSE